MKELWLEYGFVMHDGFHDVCWYNEGRWQELGHWLRKRWEWRKRKDVYFSWRLQ